MEGYLDILIEDMRMNLLNFGLGDLDDESMFFETNESADVSRRLMRKKAYLLFLLIEFEKHVKLTDKSTVDHILRNIRREVYDGPSSATLHLQDVGVDGEIRLTDLPERQELLIEIRSLIWDIRQIDLRFITE